MNPRAEGLDRARDDHFEKPAILGGSKDVLLVVPA
jgi:hypothetical protein